MQTDHAAQRGRDAFGAATRISASLLRRLSAFFRSVSNQDPKAAKFAVLNPGHAGFPKRVERSEGSNSAPIRNAPCFAVCALVCDSLSEAECVPAFTRESERGPFVREVEKQDEKRLGDKIYGSSFARFSSSAGVEGSQRTGKCMYIKAWRNIRYFAGGTKPHCGRGRESPVFRRVSRCVRSFSESRVCTRFRSEGKRGPFVREVEKRDEKRFETELVPVTFWRYSRERFWVKSQTF